MKAPLERPAEHEFEAAHGLPEILPADERLLWQGAPSAWAIARDALHLRGLGLYFGALLVARGGSVLANGASAADAALAMVWLLPLALAGMGLLGVIGWLIARTSVYTITDRRVVMRIGIVLSITFNLPYRQIESVGLKARADGGGDLTLLLADSDQIAYLNLWPHARPWQVRRSQPMLRGLRDVREIARILSTALQATLTPTTDEDAGLPQPRPQRNTSGPTAVPVRASDPHGQAPQQPSPRARPQPRPETPRQPMAV